MIFVHIRQAASVLLAVLLSSSQSFAQTQASPPQTVPNEAQPQMAPRPNPKYAKKLIELGDKELADGRFDEAPTTTSRPRGTQIAEVALIERVASMRSKLVRDHVEAAERDALAGHADVATEELAKALLIDPGNTIVTERMKQMKAMDDGPAPRSQSKIEGLPELKPRAGKQNLNLRGDTRTVYEQLGQLFGIKVTFDPDLAPRAVRLSINDVEFNTALKVLSVQTGNSFGPRLHAIVRGGGYTGKQANMARKRSNACLAGFWGTDER
jgi:hypothetical protein